MKAEPLINQDYDEQDLQSIDTGNDEFGDISLNGWLIGDLIVYMEEQPLFHPLTGEKLE